MLPAALPSVAAHGLTGTWLDEFIQLGLPIIAFVILWFWSNRKAHGKKAASPTVKDDPQP